VSGPRAGARGGEHRGHRGHATHDRQKGKHSVDHDFYPGVRADRYRVGHDRENEKAAAMFPTNLTGCDRKIGTGIGRRLSQLERPRLPTPEKASRTYRRSPWVGVVVRQRQGENWGIRNVCRLTRANGMAWVNIKCRRYYRRSRRVVTGHFGGGNFGQAMAAIDTAERMDRRIDADLKRADREVFGLHVGEVSGVERLLADMPPTSLASPKRIAPPSRRRPRGTRRRWRMRVEIERAEVRTRQPEVFSASRRCGVAFTAADPRLRHLPGHRWHTRGRAQRPRK